MCRTIKQNLILYKTMQRAVYPHTTSLAPIMTELDLGFLAMIAIAGIRFDADDVHLQLEGG